MAVETKSILRAFKVCCLLSICAGCHFFAEFFDPAIGIVS
jgi:hypothetical protein